MKEIGIVIGAALGFLIYEDERGFFARLTNTDEFLEYPDGAGHEGPSPHFPTLEALLEKLVPKRGLSVVMYHGRTQEQAIKEYDFDADIARWHEELLREEQRRASAE